METTRIQRVEGWECWNGAVGCIRSDGLDSEYSVEDVVPNLAGDSETEVEVLVMVSKVILLQVPNICREPGVVEAKRTRVST